MYEPLFLSCISHSYGAPLKLFTCNENSTNVFHLDNSPYHFKKSSLHRSFWCDVIWNDNCPRNEWTEMMNYD